MKVTIISCLALSIGMTSVAIASTSQIKVIYGEDNRKDIFESERADLVELSRSTAAMIEPYKLKQLLNGDVRINGETLEERGVCKEERFSSQISAANCSGFLIGEKTLVTAGHCVRSQSDCTSNKWVFDFKMDSESETSITVPASSIYSCKKILAQALDGANLNDYAMIELDRPVTDRQPLKIRQSGKPGVGDSVVVIGHPTGLPTKIADGAKIRANKGKYFMANLDTFGGNSGSAVFNAETHEVEGILVRGEQDYKYDADRGCEVSYQCKDDECRGEDVTYILNIPGVTDVH